MIDLLMQVVLSNLLVSGVVALAAYAVHRRGHYPVLSHLLWVLVLAKLVTPPLLTLPVTPQLVSGNLAGGAGGSGGTGGDAVAAIAEMLSTAIAFAMPVLLIAWAAGSVLVLIVSLSRIRRFDRLLRATSSPAPLHVQRLAGGLVRDLGLSSAPTIFGSSTRLSPLTWWTGGRVRVVIPADLLQQVDPERLRWVLAHELAHVKRHDYMVRWLEWLACVAFWWSPIVWWARAHLRDDEEAACDALVVDRLGVEPRSYARTLLTVIEFLSGDANRPPAVATGMDAGGSLERRLRLIVASGRIKRVPRWLVTGVLGSALVLMPLGVGSAPSSRVVDDAADAVAGDVATATSPDAAAGFAMIGGRLTESAAAALMSGDGSRLQGVSATAAPAKMKRARQSARRTVRRAIVAGLAIGPNADRASKRTARAALGKAVRRLDNAVAKGVISKAVAKRLSNGLRALIRKNHSATSQLDFNAAISTGVISARNAARLIEGLEETLAGTR